MSKSQIFFSIPHMWYTIPFVLLLLVLFVSISINLEELKVENMKSNIDLVWYVCLLCRNGKSLSWWFIQPVHSSIKYSFYTPITNKLPFFLFINFFLQSLFLPLYATLTTHTHINFREVAFFTKLWSSTVLWKPFKNNNNK